MFGQTHPWRAKGRTTAVCEEQMHPSNQIQSSGDVVLANRRGTAHAIAARREGM